MDDTLLTLTIIIVRLRLRLKTGLPKSVPNYTSPVPVYHNVVTLS